MLGFLIFMLWKTHLAFGLLLGLVIKEYAFSSFSWWIVGIIGFAALLPDIDTPVSWIGRRAKIISYSLKLFFEHRGLTHSFLFMGIIGVLGFAVFPEYNAYFIAVLFGIFAHIFLDCLTKEGVRVLWPFGFRIRGWLRTGGLVEKMGFWVVVVLMIGLIARLWPFV